MNTIRLLGSDSDRALLVEAYRWRYSAPRWFRQCLDIFKESEEEYLDNWKGELHYGIFEDDQLVAVVRLVQDKSRFFCIHLSVRRGTDWNVLLTCGLTLRNFLFEQGVVGFYGYLPTINRGIGKLYECLGFSDTGIRVFKGIIHNKIVEWKHYVITNPNAVR